MSARPEQSNGGQNYSRWFTEWPSTHVDAGQTVEVMPVAEMRERAAEIIRESIGSEVVRQCEDECSYLREAIEAAIRSIETVGQINCHGRAYHELKAALDQSRSK